MEQQYSKRKPNRLKTFDYSTAGFYFITICAKNKEKLFGFVQDGDEWNLPQMVLSDLGKMVLQQIQTISDAKYVSIDNYVVMPNHIHLILVVDPADETKKTAANAIVPHTVGAFKRFCNERAGKDLFQRSFHDRIIRNQREYEKIWTYIEDNPRRWKEDCFYTDEA